MTCVFNPNSVQGLTFKEKKLYSKSSRMPEINFVFPAVIPLFKFLLALWPSFNPGKLWHQGIGF